ncbi:MAG: guanitoxin biosynthesis heme-dependent pre-guanitoxin N-hydroxylase GntA [Maribacter sp.]
MEKIKNRVLTNVYGPMHKERVYMDIKTKDVEQDILYEYIAELRNFIKQDGYPCVGARTAVNSKSLSAGVFRKMSDSRTIRELAFGLMEYIMELKKKPSNYLTYVAIFPFDSFDDEKTFEGSLWDMLNGLHKLDSEHFEWSEHISRDPAHERFSFSFGREGFFIVGMHPESSRKARRFRYPAIAFNLHSQFENLRENGRYGIMKNAIRDNEMKFSGSINPMLVDFGEGLEAPQYSGRHVGNDWKCPFKGGTNEN